MIKHKLNSFESIELKDMHSVKLMNRKECKYAVSYNTLLAILDKLKNAYFILDIDGKRIMQYESEYFDMPNFRFYTSHQNGKQNRYKVRLRTYSLTGDKFLELKFKINKKRTIKERIKVGRNYKLADNRSFLERHLPFSVEELEKKIEVRYDRITLVDKSLKERVTLDLNLSYSTVDKISKFSDLAIIEIKYEGNRRDSKMDQILKENRIKPLSFSKYCFGISRHFTNVKKNNINMKIREINKNIELETQNMA